MKLIARIAVLLALLLPALAGTLLGAALSRLRPAP